MCITTTHWSTHVSTECATGGTGQCDGICYTHDNVDCTCSCHGDWDLPQTVEEVRVWHDEANDVVASFPDNDPGQDAAITMARSLTKDGKEYHAEQGQGRIVVVERYS